MTTSPFKFLDSYTREDIGSFFGRERETGELFRLCFTAPILVVYGGSGTGKTSLVQCGLQSKFNESDWLPVLVRRSGDLLASLAEAVTTNTLTPIKSADLGEQVANLYLDHFKPIYFLFDQFEELFIFGTHAESEAFFSAIKKLLEKERNAHVIFIVREEYLAELTRYERIIPGLIENRYRVERMARSQAMNVVEQLCATNNISCGEGFSAAMVDRLNPEGQGVELSYLQVYLDRCWRTRQNDEPFSIALLERIGYVDDLLGAFLDEQVADTPDPQRAENLLKAFVSDQGTKRQLTTGEAHEWVNAIGTAMEPAEVDRLLQVFVTKRLLKDRDERGRYELLHDALARQIFQRITRAEQELIEVRQFVQQVYGQYQKRGVKLTANDLGYLRPYRNQLYLKGGVGDFVENAFGEADRKAQQRKWKFRIGMTMLLAALIAVGIYAGRLQRELRTQKLEKQSIALAESAMKMLSADPFSAYLLAEEAFQLSPTFESEKALVSIYPFLYSEISRYKGNGFKSLPYSNTTLIFDDTHDRVGLYDSTGALVWEELGLGLRPFVGEEILDTAGIILLAGDRLVVRRVNGEKLIARGVNGPVITSKGRRDMLCISGNQLFRIDHSGRVDSTVLDTAGVHRCLKGLLEIERDLSGRYAIVKADSTVYIFDALSKDLALLHRWSGAASLKESMMSPAVGQCIVHTAQALYHLDWITPQGLQLISTVDYEKEGIALTDREPEFSSGQFQKSGIWVRFKSNPGRVYDAEQRVLLPLPGLELDDELLSYDVKKRHFIYWSYGGEAGPNPIVIRSMDGEWSRSIVQDVDRMDIGDAASDRLVVKSHSRDRNELRIVCYAPSGDTIWTKVLRTTKQGGAGGNMAIDIKGTGSYTHDETVPFPSLQTPRLLSVLDSKDRISRLLLPKDKGVHVGTNGKNDDEYMIIYSDTLISRIGTTWGRASMSGEDEFLSCDENDSAYSVRIQDGKLRVFWSTGTSDEQAYTIELNGCLDTIRINGRFVGYGARAIGRRWAYVYKSDGFPHYGIGYLVDLGSRMVIDTGAFAKPARFEALPDGGGVARLGSGVIRFLDTHLETKRTIDLSTVDIAELQRAGVCLFNRDSIEHGIFHVIDLRTFSYVRRSLPASLLGGEMLASVLRGKHRNFMWLDENGVVYLLLKREHSNTAVQPLAEATINLERKIRLVAIEPNGKTTILKDLDNVWFDQPDERKPMRVRLSSKSSRRVNGSWSSSSSNTRYVRYDLLKREFIPDERQDVLEMTFDQGERTIKRSENVLWDLGHTFGSLCSRYYYSRFRAVDHYERFPLYGADVIKEVREDKKFGEFWKHIDIEPLLKQTLH